MDSNLKLLNKHERDAALFFDEEPHKYYINGVCNNISATTLIHKYGEQFDADKVIKKMMCGKSWENSKYYGMTADEIKTSWSNNGMEAAKLGTKMHKSIENYWNKIENDTEDTDTIEFKMFLQFHKDHPDLVPYRTEWEVYQEDYDICGSIDMIFVNEDNSLSIYDWKRCKKIEKEPAFKKYCKVPVKHLPDTNYWHYSLQLNLYKFILESKYNKVIKDMHILCLHPLNINEAYQKYEIQDLQNEIKDILNHYKTNINNKN